MMSGGDCVQQTLMVFRIVLPFIAAAVFSLLTKGFGEGIYFGVRLKNERLENGKIRSIIRIYEVLSGAACFILSAVNLFLIIVLDAVLADMILMCTILAEVVFSSVFYMAAARAVIKYREKGVSALSVDAPASADGTLPISFSEGKLCPSLVWYLLHVGIIAFCVLTLYITYDDIAAYIPLWCDFNSNASIICEKSPQVLMIPIIMQVVITLICFHISARIKSAPLSPKEIRTQAQLEKSRRSRAFWSAYVCAVAFTADLAAYAYINLMFLNPEYKVIVPYALFALLIAATALTMFMSYITR